MGLSFFGQDDKAKIAVGDKEAVSTGVRANNKGIVAVGESLLALDHDFHAANIVTSSTLRCNIPNEVSGSFSLVMTMALGRFLSPSVMLFLIHPMSSTTVPN